MSRSIATHPILRLHTPTFNDIDVGESAAPACLVLDNDGLIDLIIGEYWGTLHHYEQTHSGSDEFTLVTDNFSGIDVGMRSAPLFTDLDNDGLFDLLIGEDNGSLNHYEQSEAGSYTFALVTENFNEIDVGEESVPAVAILNSDGLLDLLIGEHYGTLHQYEQAAFGSTTFTLVTENFSGIDAGLSSAPVIYDIDDDWRLDLFVGNWDGIIHHYEQETFGSSTFISMSEDFPGIDVGFGNSAPALADLDNDGLLDLLVGAGCGDHKSL